jgi:DNA-binding PadR family transcriptional regulator
MKWNGPFEPANLSHARLRFAAGPGQRPAPPRMDVRFPILGFLSEAAMTGYDLKRLFRDTVGTFYPASDGSLYPALKKLAEDGLVRMRPEHRGRRTRKVYSITPAGRAWFLARLEEPSPPVFVHDEMMIKLYFGHYRPRRALEQLDEMRHRDAQMAEYLAQVSDEMAKTEKNPFRRAVVEAGLRIVGFKARMLGELAAGLRRELGTRSPRRRTPLRVAASAR